MAVLEKQNNTQAYTPVYNGELHNKKVTKDVSPKSNAKYSQAFLLQFYKKEHSDWARPSNRLDTYLRETLKMTSNNKYNEFATTSFDEFYNKMSPKKGANNYSSLPSFPEYSPKTMPVKFNPNAKPFITESDSRMQYFLSKLRKQPGISPEKIDKLAHIVDYWQNDSKFTFHLSDIVNEESNHQFEPPIQCTTLATIYKHPIVTIARRLTLNDNPQNKRPFRKISENVTPVRKMAGNDRETVIAEWLHTLSIKERVLLKKMLDKGHPPRNPNQPLSPTSTKWASNRNSTVFSPINLFDTPPVFQQPTFFPTVQNQYNETPYFCPYHHHHHQQTWNPYTAQPSCSMYWPYL